jgi:tRNA(fMet)-specific endonuclease VapC
MRCIGSSSPKLGRRSASDQPSSSIGPLDTFIAAQAVARKLTLVSNNERELKRIAGLHLENWASV